MVVTDLNIRVDSALEGRIGRDGKPIELINGFLPFQWEGLEKMMESDRAFYFQWSTGTGKALAAEGTILARDFDLCFYIVKPNNLTDAQRKLETHCKLTGTILRGSRNRRDRILAEVDWEAENGLQPVLIFNAEKFREDKEILKLLVEGRHLLVLFDEMPTKFSNPATKLYRAAAEVLYTTYNTIGKDTKKERKVYYPSQSTRAASMFSAAMSGTPVISSPAGVFHCVRMMDTRVVPTITDFNNFYVKARDRWGNVTAWHNLDHLAEQIAPIVHSVDRHKDERVRSQFPIMMPREIALVDLDPRSQKLYDILQKEYGNIGRSSMLDFSEILAAIGTFQMICNNPRSVLRSAALREEYELAMEEFMKSGPSVKAVKEFKKKYIEGSAVALKLVQLVGNDALFSDCNAAGECTVAKMLELQDRIAKHGDKLLVFTSMNATLLPLISEWFDKWGVTHVCYHGGITSHKAKQEVLDAFRQDDGIQVFLSSDAGSTSIDLPQASLKIDYDFPWSDAELKQRDRHDRIDSVKDVIYNVSLTVPDSIEERKIEIIDEKHKYHEALFGGQIDENEDNMSARSGLLYILTGEFDDPSPL